MTVRHLLFASAVCAALGIATIAAQTQGAPPPRPPTADPYAGNPDAGTTQFPLAAPAGADSNARTVAPPGAVNQGPFDPATWKYGPAFNPPPGAQIWNPVRLKLMQGGKVTGGTLFSATDPATYCAMANAGYDFIWTEMQHDQHDWQAVARMWRTCPHANAVPGVRVAYADEREIQHALDAGALVVVVPTVDTVAEAIEARDWTYFPPLGRRSNGGGQAFDANVWGSVPGGYRATVNDNIVLILMIETLEGLKHADEIARVPGVTAIFAASGDLGNFSGYRQGTPDYERAINIVHDAAVRAGVRLCGPLAWRDRADFTCFQAGSETAAIVRGVAAELGPLVNTQARPEAGPFAAPTPFRVDEGWGKLPPGRAWGAAIGVDIARDGKSVWVFDRCATADDCSGSTLAPIQKFDASGRLVASFGAGMFNYPHGLAVDRDDNVWVSDGRVKNGRGQTVMKFSPDGKLLMTLGKPGVAGAGPDTFNGPSDILIAPSGDIFVADGHGAGTNARIVRLSRDGKFIKTWGKAGSAPGEFGAPHGLAMDSAGRLFVADRPNNRIQIFDQDGRFLAEWKQFGRPSGVFIDKNDILYAADSQSTAATNPGYTQGIRIGSVKDGMVTAFIPWAETNTLEGVAADAAGNVYGGFTNTLNFRRFVRK